MKGKKGFQKGSKSWNTGLRKGDHPSLEKMGFKKGDLNPSKNPIIIRKGRKTFLKNKKLGKHKKIRAWNYGLTNDNDERVRKNSLKRSEKLKGCKSEKKDKTFEEMYGAKRANKMRMNTSNISKERWKNKEYVKKLLSSLKVSPNKKEIKLINLINKYNLPYKFVGCGDYIIEKFNPDFIHLNDRKIIELFGDYWHNRVDYKKRDRFREIVYKRNGFKTLIIWEHELRNMSDVLNKIIKF